MTKKSQIWSGEFSRRSLIKTAGQLVGVASFFYATVSAYAAAKQSKQSVEYQEKPKGTQRCDNCNLWQAPNACKSVEGNIKAAGWCIIWLAKK
jgi:hypothetical protein